MLLGCVSLTNIILTETLTNIGASTFSGCTGLKSVRIPSKVSRIGSRAFYGCSGLSDLKFPEGIAVIGDSAFAGCRNLNSVSIPQSLTNLGANAFFGCAKLTSTYFHGNAPKGGYNAFLSANNNIVYYQANTKDWSATYGGRPTKLWDIVVQTNGSHIRIKNDQFSFEVVGSSGLVFVVEESDELEKRDWNAIRTNSLISSTAVFDAPLSKDSPNSFYRITMPR